MFVADTLFVFTSDNGPLWSTATDDFVTGFFDSNGIYSGHKASTLEGGVRVPFLVRWPGKVEAGAVNDTHVGSFADMMPTFAELVGQDTPLGVDGRSMLPVFTGQSTSERPDAMVWSFYQDFDARFDYLYGWSVRVGDWKLTKRYSAGLSLHNVVDRSLGDEQPGGKQG